MRLRNWAAVIAVAALLVGHSAPSFAAPPPPPLAAYGSLPSLSNVTLSANGRQLAFVAVSGESRRLVLQTVEGQVLGMLDLGKVNVRGLEWAGDDNIVITATQTRSLPEIGWPKTMFWTAQSYSISKKRVLNLSGRVSDTYGMIFGEPVVRVVNGEPFAYLMLLSNVGTPEFVLGRVSIQDGDATIIDRTSTDGLGWLVDSSGEPRARSRYDVEGGFWGASIRRGRSGWPEVAQASAKLDRPELVALAPGGDRIVFVTGGENGTEFVTVGLDGEATAAMPTDHNYTDVLIDPATAEMIGGIWNDDEIRLAMFAPEAKAAWEKVVRTFKGQRISLLSWSADWKKVAVTVEGPGNPGTHYLVDLAAMKADIIGDAYPGVPPEAVATVRPFSYKAADGRAIPGYLTLPPGREPKGLPLIVLPHGGPASRDFLAFDWWAQALASRGYAVLQPNFRGSSGLGLEHQVAGYGEWGRKMQTDLSDGVRALASEGLVDPKRVCITGASYGGYAAMAGPTLDPGVYRCAIAVSGVSDLPRFGAWRADRSGEKSEAIRWWNRFWGSSSNDDPILATLSPLRQAARADAPILLIHGKDDTVVPYEQSSLFARALQEAGKPVELTTLNGEDHFLSNGATRLQMLEVSVAFLLKHNPPD